jgi:flagellar motor switch protein FliN
MADNQKSNEVSNFDAKIDEMRHFMNVPVKITIQLDSCNMKVRDILQLQMNSIIELPKSAGENVDILANEQLIAFGEVLELEGCTGIRLTDFNTLT